MMLEDLEAVLKSRRSADPAESYTARLLGDSELSQRKIMEEVFELCLELGRSETAKHLVAEEAADVFYHVLVGLVSVNVAVADVLAVLERRRQ